MEFDRRVKRHLLAPGHIAWVYSGPGIARVTLREIEELLPVLKTKGEHRVGVRPRGDGAILTNIGYRELLELVCRLTTAQEVSLEIASGPVPGPASLELLFEKIRWPFFFREGERVALRIDSRASTVYHEGLIREHAEPALRAAGLVPGAASDKEAGARLTVRIERDRGRVELSLGGAPLWQRGYRARLEATAPLREDLAQAALRLAAPWLTSPEGEGPDLLFIPFCGTGTLLFEYLIARLAIPPLLFRSRYAFQGFPCGVPDSVDWARRILARELAARIEGAPPVRALLIDSSAEAVAIGRENHERFHGLIEAATGVAGMREKGGVTWLVDDALSRPWITRIPDRAASLFVPLNPPYGRRLAVGSTAALYERIGRRCEELLADLGRRKGREAGGRGTGAGREVGAASAPGSVPMLSGFILCPTEEAWRAFVLSSPSLRKETSHFSQGGIDVRLCLFTSTAENDKMEEP